MAEYSKAFLENTVSAAAQLPDSAYVTFHGSIDAPLRVLFIGNSITRHGIAPQIGWTHDWGMAASALENDYVHIIAAQLRKQYGEIQYYIAQIANWERTFWQYEMLEEQYKDARLFQADIVIVRIGENANIEAMAEHDFAAAFDYMIQYFTKPGAKVIVTDMFWRAPALDEATRRVAEAHGYQFVSINDLGDDPAMKAIGLFEHAGVAAHPCDKGMAEIARRILACVI